MQQLVPFRVICCLGWSIWTILPLIGAPILASKWNYECSAQALTILIRLSIQLPNTPKSGLLKPHKPVMDGYICTSKQYDTNSWWLTSNVNLHSTLTSWRWSCTDAINPLMTDGDVASNLNCSCSSPCSTVTDEPVIGVGVSFTELLASRCMTARAAGDRQVQDSQTLRPGWRFGWKGCYCFAVGETLLKLQRCCDTFRHVPARLAVLWARLRCCFDKRKRAPCWWLELCLSTEFYLNTSITDQLLLLCLKALKQILWFNLGLVFSSHLAMKPKGGKPPEQQKKRIKLKFGNEAQHRMWLFIFPICEGCKREFSPSVGLCLWRSNYSTCLRLNFKQWMSCLEPERWWWWPKCRRNRLYIHKHTWRQTRSSKTLHGIILTWPSTQWGMK